ncbi:MAG: hypothetical protein Q8L91_08945, partial [Polaromonas sp.]|nr:hypothetical protein [Polaromonas sp.]
FKMFGTPAADPVAPPLLGQHTQEILQGVLGYDAKKISALRESGALGTPHPAIMKSPETH